MSLRGLREGAPVLVTLAGGKKPIAATFVSQGRDSGGPWVLVDFPGGRRELVHATRVIAAPRDKPPM